MPPPRLYLAILTALTSVALGACAATAPGPAARYPLDGRDRVELLAPGVWRHVTWQDLPRWGPFPANGLIVRAPGGALVVDATWSVPQARAVIAWTERHVGPVVGVVVSHAHNDRDGGLAAFAERRIPVLGAGDLKGVGLAGEVFHPGHAHAPDNVVVWLDEPRVLFGGCMIRARRATNLGNVADAEVTSWRRATRRLQQRYPRATLVVPGHGHPGGRDLLQHTLALTDAALTAQTR